MSSLLARPLLSTRVLVGLLIGVAFATACTSTSPSQPGSGATTPSPNISIVSMSVAAETLSSGARAYRVIVKLRESGGAAATIVSIDLSFMNGSFAVASSHADRPLSDAADVLTPNSTMDSRELMTVDDDPSHPYATSVTAKVTYTDGASMTSSATASIEVPLSSVPTFTLSGLVSDDAGARAVVGGMVQVLDGPNVGKRSATDGNGNYTLPGLAAGSFTIRATANGYDAIEQGVTVAQDTRLDLRLRPISASPAPAPPPSPSACAYTVAASTSGTGGYMGGSFTATISRTGGNCSWQASSDVSWITFPGGTSGNGSATLTYVVGPNPGFNPRSGSITISWAGGNAQVRVQQGTAPDWECFVSLAKGPQDFDNVPSAGGQLTASASTYALPAGWSPQCGASVFGSVPWISGGGSIRGGQPGATTFTFSVAANPSPGTARSGSVVVEGGGKRQTVAVTQR